MAGGTTFELDADGFKRLKRRVDKAWQHKRQWQPLMDQVYRYVLPYRDATQPPNAASSNEQVQRMPGQSRTDVVFDATAPTAAVRFAGRIQQDVTPTDVPFFKLEAGPLVPPDQRKPLNETFSRIAEIAHGVLSTGNFHTSSHEGYVDLYGGTMNLLASDGDDRDLVRWTAVPDREVALEAGPYGDIWGRHWKHQWCAEMVPEMWPKARQMGFEWSQALRDRIRDNPYDEIEICQATRYNRTLDRHELVVWWTGDSDERVRPIWTETFRISPWVSPRFFKVPGEVYGRGPAMLALPFIKTTNKARELALKAAAFAVLGLWMARNDGIFNPDTAVLGPGRIWTVRSTDGPLGASIQKLPLPENFDISSIIIEEERQQMKRALFDDTLPPEAAAVRSATEIMERVKYLNQDLNGIQARLMLELVRPEVTIVIDRLERKGLLPTNITIDQLLTKLSITSAVAAGNRADQAKRMVDWLTISAQFFGKEGLLVAARVEKLLPDIGRMLGVDEQYVRSQQEGAQIQKMLAQLMATQAAADADALPGQQKGGSGSAEAGADQPWMNGGF